MMAVGLFFFASATHVATTCRHPALQSKNKRHARHGAERGSNQNPDLSRIQQRSAERQTADKQRHGETDAAQNTPGGKQSPRYAVR